MDETIFHVHRETDLKRLSFFLDVNGNFVLKNAFNWK